MEDTPSTVGNHLEQAPRSSIVTPQAAQVPSPSTDPVWFRFSSGTDGSLAQQEFVLCINARDYEGARVILAEQEAEFTRFQRNMSCWVLSMLERSAAAV